MNNRIAKIAQPETKTILMLKATSDPDLLTLFWFPVLVPILSSSLLYHAVNDSMQEHLHSAH